MIKATLVATLMMPPSTGGDELSALPDTVEWLEVRADLLGDVDPDWLRSHFRGRLLYSLRSRSAGGNFDGSIGPRHDRLSWAVRAYDLIELEGERDFSTELLARIPIEKRLVSWHGPAGDLSGLNDRFKKLSTVPAQYYKLVTETAKCSDELTPLLLLNSLNRSDTIAYSIGPLGFWSRLVAPRLGAPIIFGLVPGGPVVPAEPTINKLIEDYGLPQLAPLEGINGIVGNPVFHSLSPRLHNAAYREMNYPALFVPFHTESFSEFWQEMVEGSALATLNMPIKGLTVVSPHKEAALRMTSLVSPIAQRAESANILVLDNGSWKADTTDLEVVAMLERDRGIRIDHKRAAVIGCGGSGRAIAAALDQFGATVILVNRSTERGRYASQLLGFPCIPLERFSAEGYDIVVNATSLGCDDGEVPFPTESLENDAVVIDLVYGSEPTPLITRARALGRVAIDGREVLSTQVLRQIKLMTNQAVPAQLVHENLGLEFEQSDFAGCLF